jgi:hypothetical protein
MFFVIRIERSVDLGSIEEIESGGLQMEVASSVRGNVSKIKTEEWKTNQVPERVDSSVSSHNN